MLGKQFSPVLPPAETVVGVTPKVDTWVDSHKEMLQSAMELAGTPKEEVARAMGACPGVVRGTCRRVWLTL